MVERGKYPYKKLELFSVEVPADTRRNEFDLKNETIIVNQAPVDFVFIGDSITNAFELTAYFYDKKKIIINRAIAADNSTYVLKRFPVDIIQLKAKYAIVNIGVADTFQLEPDHFGKKPGKTIDEVKKSVVDNFLKMIELCEQANQKLIICSILPTNMPWFHKFHERGQLIVGINQELKKMCEEKGLIYIDYHSHMADEDGMTLRDELADDGLHPHVLGYNIMGEVLQKTLAENGIEI